jgi:hypothetical protein
MTTPQEVPTPTSINLPELVLPLGWNALVNNEKKTALICGEYKVIGKAFSKLEVLNKASKQELLDAITALGYNPLFPSQVVPAPPIVAKDNSAG